VSDHDKDPARISSQSMTECMMRALEDASGHDYTRCVIIAMDDDGIHRSLYSNARSEPEMFGMITMAEESFTEDIYGELP
jgi:hypothetical protein